MLITTLFLFVAWHAAMTFHDTAAADIGRRVDWDRDGWHGSGLLESCPG